MWIPTIRSFKILRYTANVLVEKIATNTFTLRSNLADIANIRCRDIKSYNYYTFLLHHSYILIAKICSEVMIIFEIIYKALLSVSKLI